MAHARHKPRVRAIQRRKVARKAVSSLKTAIVRTPTVAESIEKVLIQGDLSPLSTEQRLEYYRAVCKSLGLNPLTRPFDYIAFKETENSPAKLVLYAKRDAGDQLRKIHGVAVLSCKHSVDEQYATAEVMVQDRTGRTDTGLGMVSLLKFKDGKWLKMSGRELANARMKAETKAKRRATLSICGLGILDETELDTMNVRYLTPQGRIIEPAEEPAVNPYEQRYLEREKEALGKMTPAQREVYERKMSAGAESRAVDQAGSSTEPSHRPTAPIPCLFYTHYPESDTYLIDGEQGLKEANRDLLAPMWSATAKQIIATPAELGKLLSKLEERKVSIRALERA